MIESYRDLKAWRDALDLVDGVYRLSGTWPTDERFGLIAQIRRAAVSVPSVLAEGHARASTREYVRYVSVSLGSLAELETQLIISVRLGYTRPDECDALLAQADEIGRMLRGLQKALDAKLQGGRQLAP